MVTPSPEYITEPSDSIDAAYLMPSRQPPLHDSPAEFVRGCVLASLSAYPFSIFALERIVRDVRVNQGMKYSESDLARVCETVFELHDEGLVRIIRTGINRGKQELTGHVPIRR